MSKVKESVEVLKLYLKMADAFYTTQEQQGAKFTKGRLKFRKDVREAVTHAIVVLEKLNSKELEVIISEWADNQMDSDVARWCGSKRLATAIIEEVGK